ncbi:MAG: Nif3-like dinuclear metal center hexameric protein [Synergistaceae bacterium]|nr:Nif3-like dinuclear metal center hexameric protein [Synergistaceae bacterium]
MKLSDVIALVEKRIPLEWSEEWDNPGLIVGDADSEIVKIGVVLDVTEDAVLKAADSGCQLLVSHHPIIFRPLKNIIPDRPAGKAIVMSIKSGISLYAAHTNWDSSPEGVNFTLAELLGLDNIEPLVPPAEASSSWGMGAVGELMMPISFNALMQLIKERWCLSSDAGYGSQPGMIRKIALGGGSCGEMWEQAAEKGASFFITADMSYHDRQDALNSGLKLIDVDHGEMERASLFRLKSVIEKETGLAVEIIPETNTEKITL